MTRRNIIIPVVLLGMAIVLLATPARAVDGRDAAAVTDHWAVPVIPAVYGEIIGNLPVDEMADITAVLNGIKVFNYLKGLGDMAAKVEDGRNMDATLDAAMLGANLVVDLMADQATGKLVLAGLQVSTLPVSALIIAADIARKSCDEVRQSEMALKLESLYYSIESDPALKTRGRKLGQGDPIRTDRQAVEHLWRKVIRDERWRDLFKNYVVNELNQTWPEPSLWDRMTVDSDVLEEAALLQEKRRLQAHVLTILHELNKVGRKREAGVLTVQRMHALAAMCGKISPEELSKALLMYRQTVLQLPEIEAYAARLPVITADFQSRMEKADARGLVELRAEKIPAELKIITRHAGMVRNLPDRGRDAGTRRRLLEQLSGGFAALVELRGTATRAEIDRRLADEIRKMDVAGCEFVFTRHECPGDFYDMKAGLEQEVLAGIMDGPQADKVREQARRNLENVQVAYDEDFTANRNLYDEKRSELLGRINHVRERLDAATGTREIERLKSILSALEHDLATLDDRFNDYETIHQVNSAVDLRFCEEVLTDIDEYVRVGEDRFDAARDSLLVVFRDAAQKYARFWQIHGPDNSSCQAILGTEEIEHIRAMVSESFDGYAGIDLSGLQGDLHADENKPCSLNVRDTLADMQQTLHRMTNNTFGLRRTYYGVWMRTTVPSLEYMQSPRLSAELAPIEAALTDAKRAYGQADPGDLPQDFRADFARQKEHIDLMLQGLQGTRRQAAAVAGLAGRLRMYIQAAENINTSAEEDGEYLLGIEQRFAYACQLVTITNTRFIVEASRWNPSYGTLPPVLDGGLIVKALEDNDILGFSRRHRLDIERLVAEPFVEIRIDGRHLCLHARDFLALAGAIEDLPRHSHEAYLDGVHAMRSQADTRGALMGLLYAYPNGFAGLFDFGGGIGTAARKAADAYRENKQLAGGGPADAGARSARADYLLDKIMPVLEPLRGRMEAGDYAAVMAQGWFYDQVLAEYRSLDDTRPDLDAALSEFEDLLARARRAVQARERERQAEQATLQKFYSQFRKAYEQRNAVRLVDMIDDDWIAGDGTTIDDLEVNLSGSFRIFDEVRCDISNLELSPCGEDLYQASYDITITGRIYRRNIEHVEKSSVSETVRLKPRPRIVRTTSGRFWTPQ